MNKALLIGINQYKDAPLNGCVNDVLLLQKLFLSRGYDVDCLTDKMATKTNILEQLEALLASAKKSDSVIFHFSGHGSQVPDKSGDEKDGLDECLLPYDYTWDNVILDDDIDALLSKYTGMHVEVIIDACHSGTGTRNVLLSGQADNFTSRYIRPPMELFTHLTNHDVRIKKIGKNVVTWSGCRDDQTSADAQIDGSYNGIFTYALYNNLNGPRHCMLNNIRQYIAQRAFSQVPQLSCSFGQIGKEAFTIGSSIIDSIQAKLKC